MKRTDLWFTALLVPLDLFSVIVSVLIANSLRVSLDILPQETGRVSATGIRFLIWFFPLLVFFLANQRLYILSETRSKIGQSFKVISACAAVTMILLMVILLGRTTFIMERNELWYTWASRISLLTVFYLWIANSAVITLVRSIYRSILNWMLSMGIGKRTVLLVGNTSISETLLEAIRRDSSLGYSVIGVIATNERAHQSIPYLGKFADLQSIVHSKLPDHIIACDPDLEDEKVLEIIDIANDHHSQFTFAPNLFEVLATNVTVSNIGGVPLINLRPTPLDGWGKILKRTMDIVASAALLVLLSPIFVLFGLLVFLQDRGPIFFAQERVTLGRTFKILKFRSMIKNAEALEDTLRKNSNEREDGPLFKMKKDPRITPLGRFMRKSRVDELPQLFNVLIGDMSLIGPRPHLAKEVAHYEKHHRKVLAIKPGMSGLAQISGSSELSFEDEVRLDTYYIENWSLMKDIEIFLKTPLIILLKDRSGS